MGHLVHRLGIEITIPGRDLRAPNDYEREYQSHDQQR